MNRPIFISNVLILFSLTMSGQTDFKWDIIIDSLPDLKDELYSKNKMFIGETWKSAQDVIQNDDKNAGIVLVKGASVQHM